MKSQLGIVPITLKKLFIKGVNMAKETTSPKLAVPSDLNEKARQKIADSVNPLVADAFALYVKTKSFHWHLSGSHFRDYHLLFDEQAEQIFATIDLLAERVRKLGRLTIRSVGEINHLKNVEDNNAAFVTPQQMIKELMEDNKAMIKRMREAHKVCDEGNDVATASLLEVFIDETERRTWFLFELLQ
jgi:starvation-inducible DNA-binding protein